MIHIHFGNSFNDSGYLGQRVDAVGHHVLGPRGLRDLLERTLGLPTPTERLSYERILFYRRALANILVQKPDVFYAASFGMDAPATSEKVLNWRDSLVGSGWDFEPDANAPLRLQTLAAVEALYAQFDSPMGFEDRISRILSHLDRNVVRNWTIDIYDPIAHFPPILQRLIEALQQLGSVKVEFIEPEKRSVEAQTDLGAFQRYLLFGEKGTKLQADGSIHIIEAESDYEAARYLATHWAENGISEDQLCLIPSGHVLLDQVCVENGLPAMGSRAGSRARPLSQILILAPNLLWDPIDPVAVLQFLQLSFDHIPWLVRNKLIALLSQKPGVDGPNWHATINDAIAVLEEKDTEAAQTAREAIDFWFGHPRYSLQQGIPASRLIEIYQFLAAYGQSKGSKAMRELSVQASQIVALLESSGLTHFSSLLLDQVLRLALEPVVQTTHMPEANHVDFVFVPTAIGSPAKEILWWNCVDNLQLPPMQETQNAESEYLTKKGALFYESGAFGRMQLRSIIHPAIMAEQKLTLIVPDLCNGEATSHHPIVQYLKEFFGNNLLSITKQALAESPATSILTNAQLPEPQSFLQSHRHPLERVGTESPTSLDNLIHYPHIWVFERVSKWRRENIPSAADNNTLLGTLSHAALEWFFNQNDILQWSETDINERLFLKLDQIIREEGAILYHFGREAERHKLVSKTINAAHSLQKHLIDNGWQVHAVENRLNGTMPDGNAITGFADLILVRDNEFAIIDLKWAGSKSYLTEKMSNQKDLQLMWYARMLNPNVWSHTSYYLISQDILLSRNRQAFAGAELPAGNIEFDHIAAYEAMWQKTNATLQWRRSQLDNGQIELRNTATIVDLENAYAQESLLDLLELPKETYKFDAYLSLLGLRK